jgi:hypothetical protein
MFTKDTKFVMWLWFCDGKTHLQMLNPIFFQDLRDESGCEVQLVLRAARRYRVRRGDDRGEVHLRVHRLGPNQCESQLKFVLVVVATFCHISELLLIRISEFKEVILIFKSI